MAKVNDADGNPIEIAAVVVWQVADTAQALYAVDEFPKFVAIQAETAVRHIASSREVWRWRPARLAGAAGRPAPAWGDSGAWYGPRLPASGAAAGLAHRGRRHL